VRRLLLALRIVATLFWLACLGLDITAPLSFWEYVLMAAYLAMLAMLLCNLGFPKELQARLRELETRNAAPREALP